MMIHQLLNLTRPLFVVDTETTGTDVKTDRVIEVGFQMWTSEGLKSEYRTLVNPLVPIPNAASKVHGIYDLDMHRCQTCKLVVDDVAPDRCRCEVPDRVLTFRQLAPNLARGFSNCDFAGKNVRFDLRIIAAEMVRNGVPWDYSEARVVDGERLEQLAVPRSLGHLYAKYVRIPCVACNSKGWILTMPSLAPPLEIVRCDACNGVGSTGKPHEGAHGALSDVQASTAVIVGQLTTWPDLPRDLDALHAAQWPGMIDLDNKFRFVDGVACFTSWGKYAGKPMTAADNGYWDFILKNDFAQDVKRLASAAKLGKYPEVKS